MKTVKRSIALFLSLCVVLCGFGVNFSVFAADPVVNVQFNAMDSQMNCDMEPAQDNTVKDLTAHTADFLEGTGAVKFRFQKERQNLQFMVRGTGSNEAGSGSDYDKGVDIAGATHMIFDLYVSDVSQWTIAGTRDTGLRGLESKKTTGDWFSEECGVIHAEAVEEAFSNVRNGWNHIVLPIDRTNATSTTMWGFRLYFYTGVAKADFYIMMDDVRFVNQAYLDSDTYKNNQIKTGKGVKRVQALSAAVNSMSASAAQRVLQVEANVTYHSLANDTYRNQASSGVPFTVVTFTTSANDKGWTDTGTIETTPRATVNKGDYAFSLAVVNDLHYAVRKNAAWNNVYQDTMRWILKERDKENIKMVLQLGDLTSNVDYNQRQLCEWNAVRAGFDILREADPPMPFATVVGNHDRSHSIPEPTTYYNTYFPYKEQVASNPYLGGAMKEGYTENLYYTFEVSGVKYMILTLELYPGEEVLKWADSVVKAHPDHNVIMMTHSYLLSQDTYNVIHTVEHEDPAYTGQQVWDQLIKCNPNIIMTLSAHNEYPKGLAGLGLLKGTNDAGKTVYQFLVGDPQTYDLTRGGIGSVTMLRFSEDGKQVNLEYITTKKDARLAAGISDSRHLTKNYITVDVEPVVTPEDTTVTLSEWSAEDLLNAAKATGTTNAAGNTLFAPDLANWKIGQKNANAPGHQWIFTNAERDLFDQYDLAATVGAGNIENYTYALDENGVLWATSKSDSTDKQQVKVTRNYDVEYAKGDALKVEIYAKVQRRAEYEEIDQAAGYLTLILHNRTDCMLNYLFDDAALAAAQPAPEKGEGVMKYTWNISSAESAKAFRELVGDEQPGTTVERNKLQFRARVFQGSTVEFYGINLFNETKQRFLYSVPVNKMTVNSAEAGQSQSEEVRKEALVTYTGLHPTGAGFTNAQADRALYNGGSASKEQVLLDLPLGHLYTGTTTLNLDFASGYGLGSHRKFTLKVQDSQGKVLKETLVSEDIYRFAGYDRAADNFYHDDSATRHRFSLDLEVPASGSGEEYTLSVITYNETDLALFGASLTKEVTWQNGFNPETRDEDGQVVIKSWDYMSLAKLDGDYTSSEPNGTLPQIQYTTDFDSDNPGKVPIGIEYYSEVSGGVKINMEEGDTSGAVSAGVIGDVAEIKIQGVNLQKYQGQKLTVEMETFLTGTQALNPWVRLYHGGNSNADDNGIKNSLVLDFNINADISATNNDSGNELGRQYDTQPLEYDATYGYAHKKVKGQREVGVGADGFHNLYASVWLFANKYHYTTTNTYRIYDYTLKDASGNEIFSLEGEDWIAIADQQNAAKEDGTYRQIKARVLWGYKADSYSVNGYKSIGGTGTTWIDEVSWNGAEVGAFYPIDTVVDGKKLHQNDRPRAEISVSAPKGLDGKTMIVQLYYEKSDGTTALASDSSFRYTSDSNGNFTCQEGKDYLGSNDYVENINGSSQKFSSLVFLGPLTPEAYTATQNGTLKRLYVKITFDQTHDFSSYPVYFRRIRFNLIRAFCNDVTTCTGSSTEWLRQKILYAEEIDPNNSYATYGPAMEPYYAQADNSPSTTPLDTISADGATETKLLYKGEGTENDTTYSEELSFTQPGHYEVVWEVSGPSGSDFEIALDRDTKDSFKRQNQNYLMDGTRKICVLPFEVIDITDRYTFRMDADKDDISLWKGEIRVREMAIADGVVYNDLNTAMEEISAGSAVEMLQSDSLLNNASVAVPAGAFLDLRGNTLTAKHLVSFGQVQDSGKANVPGGLALVDEDGQKITSAQDAALILQEDNKTMPLFDADLGGYRFFDYTFENAGTKTLENGNKAVFGYFLKFDHADAYTLLASDQAGFAIDVNVRWTGSHTYHHHIAADTIKGFAGAVKAKLDGGAKLSDIKTAITLSIGGVNLLGQNDILCTTPTVRSENTRVESSAGEEVYNKIA